MYLLGSRAYAFLDCTPGARIRKVFVVVKLEADEKPKAVDAKPVASEAEDLHGFLGPADRVLWDLQEPVKQISRGALVLHPDRLQSDDA